VVTLQDFLALPESMRKMEFIRGEVYMAPSPEVEHQDIVGRFYAALVGWTDGRRPQPFVGLAPLDVRLDGEVIVQPDVFVLLGGRPKGLRRPIGILPDLCVEVLSSDRAHDRVTKHMLYRDAGIREYWIVWQSGWVERLHGPRLELVEEVRERLTSPLLPGFELDLAELRERLGLEG